MSIQRQVLGYGLLMLLFVLPAARLSDFITWSWWVVGGVSLILLFIATNLIKLQSAPTAEEVTVLAERIRKGEGQKSTLRCLYFMVPQGRSFKKDSRHALVLLSTSMGRGISVHLSVDWISSQKEEENTPAGMQRYAEGYVKEMDGTMLRNDIRPLAGVYGVDFEYTTPRGKHRRKIVLVKHRSEYVITMNAENSSIWGAMIPVVEAFLETFSMYQPHFPRQTALNGRVWIGVPMNWRRVEDTASSASWRSDVGETKLWLRLLGEDQGATFTAKLFEGVKGSLFQHLRSAFYNLPETDVSTIGGRTNVRVVRDSFYNLPETGVSTILCELTEPYRGQWRCRCAQGMRLPTGLHVVLDFEHIGSDQVIFDGLVLQPYVLLNEIVATIEDARS
jgi:hypothetical protein